MDLINKINWFLIYNKVIIILKLIKINLTQIYKIKLVQISKINLNQIYKINKLLFYRILWEKIFKIKSFLINNNKLLQIIKI